MIQRERLHALGRMASGIAHDFNNALAPILGFSELLLRKPETLRDEERARGYIEMIHTAAEDSAKIVARLREFYRYREENDLFTPVSLNDLIQQVISLTQPRWKDQAQASGVYITIKTELQNIPTIAGNEAELREMLLQRGLQCHRRHPGAGDDHLPDLHAETNARCFRWTIPARG